MINKISFVIPVYNEEENIKPLYSEITAVAKKLGYDYEIMFVDDASNDNSFKLIKELSSQDSHVKYVSFAVNCGQSAALYAGFQNSSGDVIITMDADLQNDPNDILEMIKYYPEYDVVNGWRYNRQDSLSKKIGSKIGNFVRNLLTKETIKDTGCALKILRGDMVRRIKMFKGLHRFIPTLMRLEGAKVIEVKVNHRPRIYGQSKYTNLRRAIEGFYDLIVVRWMIKRFLKIKVKESNV
ncbi:dolichol-phosphate mannosyltransferase [Deferribacter desulfuricans SSM1]|uniref:Dolichol-phosphate mannosyltransferase n=1 Tax=Deferribacter desulfuricans (strain DSM 14783 / JCM 11476 / NBRC 101012 / SSM1) TaxID=639282 RepID=D3PCY2_DEFDS|nr:glycosyltransferase family 2 protein [Deferribacter desulfuricans]BAI80455.1 dolichol-phosphate mannosyltransferase [Deferribacter desulfuricans SSM1]